MTQIQSQIDTNSAVFIERSASMDALVTDLHKKIRESALSAGPEVENRHHAKGKLLPRERITRLLDPGSPFLELSQLTAYKVY